MPQGNESGGNVTGIRERGTWPTTVSEAVNVQRQLRGSVISHDDFEPAGAVAGVDVGFEAGGAIARAAVAVLSYPDLLLMDWAVAREPTRFPYVPGLLSFRELPVILAALDALTVMPDLILCDGHGVSHPRRFGIACHLGVTIGIPTIGVAKSRLIGTHEALPDVPGASVPLMQGGEQIGRVLRTRLGVKPLYVSVGHRVSLAAAERLTLASVSRYRLPETTRWAHHLASESRCGD